jgi:hypothetical protein
MQVLQQDIDLTTIAKNDLAMITMVDPTALLQVLQWEEDELATITMVDPTSLTIADHEADTSKMLVVRSPSTDFSKTPKKTEEPYGHGSNVLTGIVVVRFDSARFVKFSDKDSPKYNPSYCDNDENTEELSQTNKVWISRGLLVEVMELLTNVTFSKYVCAENLSCATGRVTLQTENTLTLSIHSRTDRV